MPDTAAGCTASALLSRQKRLRFI